jgi:hypothetical protein
MSANGFKTKPVKKTKINEPIAVTLDGKHREIMNKFQEDDIESIPKLQEEKVNIIKDLNENKHTIEDRLNIQDRVNEINAKIRELKKKKKEYLLTNSKHIFDYFENKKNISNMDTTVGGSKNKVVDQFFKISGNNEQDNTTTNTNNIVNTYLSNVDESFINVNSFIHSSNICMYCKQGEMIPLEDEGVLLCNKCFRNNPYLIENEKPSYKEPPKEVCFYAYKRINHFKEIIAQFQGKETTQIPPEVIENIKLQIKKERIDMSQVSNIKTKEILKKLGYNKYYEHIPFIKDKLGIKPPIMSQEFEETLYNLFMELQAPYSKFCPDDRVNFLNYYYTAYKLCELLGETQYLEHFPMLKDREKRLDQDNIWKQICKELNWEFIPTI